jgi:hypothetical protein
VYCDGAGSLVASNMAVRAKLDAGAFSGLEGSVGAVEVESQGVAVLSQLERAEPLLSFVRLGPRKNDVEHILDSLLREDSPEPGAAEGDDVATVAVKVFAPVLAVRAKVLARCLEWLEGLGLADSRPGAAGVAAAQPDAPASWPGIRCAHLRGEAGRRLTVLLARRQSGLRGPHDDRARVRESEHHAARGLGHGEPAQRGGV